VLDDQQLIEELRARLRQQAAGLEPPDRLLTDLERRHVRRIRHTRLMAVAASAIVMAAVTTLSVMAGGKVARQAPAEPASTTVTSALTPTPSSAPQTPQTAEQLLQRAREALVGSEDLVVHVRCQTRTVYGVMRLDLEGWVLESAGRSRVLFYSGTDTPQADTVYTRSPGGSTTTESLDLTQRTVATVESPSAPYPLIAGISLIGDPRVLLTGISYTTDGLEDLNGRPSFRLSGPEGSHLRVWLDAETYQLVRVLTSANDIAYEWLPRNPEHLALLEHKVPADFKRR